MAKALKKKLPKDFEQLLKADDLTKLQAVFEVCEIDARGGYSEATAFLMPECPDELARWLVAQGADIRAVDRYGYPAIHSRLYMRSARSMRVLIELGCDVQEECSLGTPLHVGGERINVDDVRLLLEAGAELEARSSIGYRPLDHA